MINRSFYFLRHGETDGNVHKLFHGRTNTQLNDNGRAQAERAASILANSPIDRIIASPLDRARETAEIVNKIIQKPITFDKGLSERNYGVYEGMTIEQIEAWVLENNHDDGPIVAGTKHSLPPNGEAYLEFRDRIIYTLNDNLDTYPDENILFVSHGGVFNAIYFKMFQEKKPTLNAHPYHFERNDGKWSLNCLVTQYEDKLKHMDKPVFITPRI